MTPRDELLAIAKALDGEPRRGAPVDEPEGQRTVTLSHSLAEEIATRLRRIAGELPS